MTAVVLFGERLAIEPLMLGGIRLCRLMLPHGRWQARRGAKLLKRNNIQTAAFVKGFPYTDIFAKYGIFPVDIRPLRLAAAVPIACAALRKTGIELREAFVAVRAPRLSVEVETLVMALSQTVRYVSLDAAGKEVLGERLRFRCGVALREDADNAVLTLSLFEDDRCDEKTLALFDRKLHIFYGFAENIEGIEEEALLAAMLHSGWQGAEFGEISLH